MAASADLQKGMGVALAIIEMATEMTPPRDMSARTALDQYAEVAEVAAAKEFGEREWESFKRAVRKAGRSPRGKPEQGPHRLILSDDERKWLIYALDVAVDEAASWSDPLPADQWRELRKALAI